MEIEWVRGNDKVDYSRPNVFFTMGTIGSGKSSLLEHLACQHVEKGTAILDLLGSRDAEGLAWLRSPHVEDRKVLLLRGEACDVSCSWDTKTPSEFKNSDLETYDFLINASPLYSGMADELLGVQTIVEKIFNRRHWRRQVFCLVREASDLLYSRITIVKNQDLAKGWMVYALKQARHSGLALALDSVRWTSIDINCRELSNYLFVKKLGVMGLPDDLRFLYRYWKPYALQTLPPEFFVVLTQEGSIGMGEFPFPEWHKQEKEDIMRSVGVEVEYGTPVEQAQDRGTYTTVSDLEHAQIVKLYIGGSSMNKISGELGRSTKTVKDHIDEHNEAVSRSGFCPSCRRVHSEHESSKASRE